MIFRSHGLQGADQDHQLPLSRTARRLVREITGLIRRTLKRVDLTARSFFAVTGPTRSPAFADIPTLAEAGVPDPIRYEERPPG